MRFKLPKSKISFPLNTANIPKSTVSVIRKTNLRLYFLLKYN